jgi:glycolate oxidase FAD binding subunit
LPIESHCTPSNPDDVIDALRGAYERGTPVYPIGGGTSLNLGAMPERPGLGLSLTNLTRLIDYPARDLTITVEAGMSIASLTKHLAAERQRLPIDVPQADRATIGGVVATNPIGPRRYRWGSTRLRRASQE